MILVLCCRENRYVVVLWKMGVKMYISRVKLYNWKNFRECDVRLSERCFVVGANATGKSNFLDVFRFLRDIVKEGGRTSGCRECSWRIEENKMFGCETENGGMHRGGYF